jgi:hypothetical protein
MNIWVAFGALIVGVIVWFFLVRREHAIVGAARIEGHVRNARVMSAKWSAPARIALRVSSRSSLRRSGCSSRVISSAWATGMAPYTGSRLASRQQTPILWFNTAMLVLSSAAMQAARRAVRFNQRARVRGYLFVESVAISVFSPASWSDGISFAIPDTG